jgi:hypothetical protein
MFGGSLTETNHLPTPISTSLKDRLHIGDPPVHKIPVFRLRSVADSFVTGRALVVDGGQTL